MIEVWASIDLEGVFSILLHEKKKDHNKSEKTSDIGKSLINLFKATIDNNSRTWPSHYDAGKLITTALGLFGYDLGKIIDYWSFLWPTLLVREDTFICANFEFGNE